MLHNSRDTPIDLSQLTFNTAGIKFLGIEEKSCARLLNKWLGLKIENGVTYQKSIDGKHAVDFYIPESNIVVEWHPIILKWYMRERNFKQLRHVLKGMDGGKAEQIRDIIADEIKHNYTSRRRFLLDRSHDRELQTSKLIVVENERELFDQVLKPLSKYAVKLEYVMSDFKEFKNG